MSDPAQLSRFPVQCVQAASGAVQYRQSGQAAAVTHVLLHGIGSGSASWVAQLQAADGRSDCRLLAWEAPGYGDSAPVAPASPVAVDYAQRLWTWLDALDVRKPVVLVGHSLGCLMAASAAVLQPARLQRLVLLSPARGYGDAPAAERSEKLQSRLTTLQRLGPEGMAQTRAGAMLSPSATPQQIEAVRQTMSQVRAAGYTQAAHLLANGVLSHDLVQLQMPISVASGEADTITPPAACQQVAQQVGVAWQNLGAVGHACPLQAGDGVNALLGLGRTQAVESSA
jgi:pimeloyl-ACP methyl ester carboxylesterase